jgi:SAM-dependent methyltransferase
MDRGETLSSFRDPSGTVLLSSGRVFRRVYNSAAVETDEFLRSQLAIDLIGEGKLVGTREIADEELRSGCGPSQFSIPDSFGSSGRTFEHDRVWFASFPYEWPPEMLFSAGELTLDIAEASVQHGYGLKDATPYNVLFRSSKPVFVDILSFELRDPGDFIWLPYGQFVRMFLLPLLLQKHLGIGLDQLFTMRAHGLEPEEVYGQFGWRHRLRPPLLTEVSIPTWLRTRGEQAGRNPYAKRTTSNPEKARFILSSQLRRLRRALRKARPEISRNSNWASYMRSLSYSEEEFHKKHVLVERAANEIRPQATLDVGCNTGHFSAIAAKAGSRVVALDIDPVVVGKTWRRALDEDLDILPLVVNLARPTPATGWRNSEYPSFLSRASGSFDLVLMLATLHHLLVTERIPLGEIVDLISELTTGYVVIEYVAKEDPMFQQITRGRAHLHDDFTREVFEKTCSQHFSIIRSEPVKGDLRILYLLRKKRP